VKAISFKDPLVLAIESGAKTQTRRLVALRDFEPSTTSGYAFDWRDKRGQWNSTTTAETLALCPYPVGSRAWVKQRLVRSEFAGGTVAYGTSGMIAYNRGHHAMGRDLPIAWPWKPAVLGAMYCPRWASRITLEVESVRVERLADMTEADAIAEGVTPCGGRWLVPGTATERRTAREAFEALWDSINGAKPGASWADSPWVWAITFRRVETA
jgi:hypothetical protein